MSDRDKLARVRLQMHRTERRVTESEPREFVSVTSAAIKNQDPLGVKALVERFNEKKGKQSVPAS